MTTPNTEERIAELRKLASAHQTARMMRGAGSGYSVRVLMRERDGTTAEHDGYLASVDLMHVRIALLSARGGGFRTCRFRHMVLIERAEFDPALSRSQREAKT